jgi:hypothetical protein
MNLLGDLKGVVGGTQSWLASQWTNRIIQLSVFATIIFYVLSSFKLIEEVEKLLAKTLRVKVGKDATRVVHAVIFGVFMYFGTRFILDPVASKLSNAVEGLSDKGKGLSDKGESAKVALVPGKPGKPARRDAGAKPEPEPEPVA